jgi:hypothetical protein
MIPGTLFRLHLKEHATRSGAVSSTSREPTYHTRYGPGNGVVLQCVAFNVFVLVGRRRRWRRVASRCVALPLFFIEEGPMVKQRDRDSHLLFFSTVNFIL